MKIVIFVLLVLMTIGGIHSIIEYRSGMDTRPNGVAVIIGVIGLCVMAFQAWRKR